MQNNEEIKPLKHLDIVGLGNPLLDVVIQIEETMLEKLQVKKGSMNLIDERESQRILEQIGEFEKQLTAGGSTSNIMVGASILGSRTTFLGMVGRDEYGRIYQAKIEKKGVLSKLAKHEKNVTGHCLILITPDGERTMLTHLGAASNFEVGHLGEAEIRGSKILHIEAYQLEDLNLRPAVLKAIEVAKEAEVLVSLDLSDSGLIMRNREFLQALVKQHIDIVFANEQEALVFAQTLLPQQALHKLAELCAVAVVKLGEKGSLIKQGGKVFDIKPHQVEMVNTNGAGDMYAGVILHGLANGLDLEKAGKMASHLSALVVASAGAHLDEKHFKVAEGYRKK
ncbi:MAG: adenosine kinase [Candidatus Moraniibacteriota bacterium]